MTAITTQDFNFAISVSRAWEDDGAKYFEGVASSTKLDSHDTKMSLTCQEGFAFDIRKGMEDKIPVILEVEHMGEDEPMNEIGWVTQASVNTNGQLQVICRFDSDNPKAMFYYNKMTKKDPITQKPKQFGLSINGIVDKAHWEFDEEASRTIQVFDRVILKKIGLVRKPSNPDSWVTKIIRSVDWDAVERQEISRSEDLSRGLCIKLELEVEHKGNSEKDEELPGVGEMETPEAPEIGESGDEPAELVVMPQPIVGVDDSQWLSNAIKQIKLTGQLPPMMSEDEFAELRLIWSQLKSAMGSPMDYSNREMNTSNMSNSIHEDLNESCLSKRIDDDMSFDLMDKLAKTNMVTHSSKELEMEKETRDELTPQVGENAVERSEESAEAVDTPADAPVDVPAEVAEAAETVEETPAEQATEAAEVTESVEEVAEVQEVAEAVVESEPVKRKSESDTLELVRGMFAELSAKFDAVSDKLSSVQRENSELVEKNKELVERVEKFEAQPTTIPGIGVSRTADDMKSESLQELRAQAIRKAAETGDKVEALRLIRDKSYTGKDNLK